MLLGKSLLAAPLYTVHLTGAMEEVVTEPQKQSHKGLQHTTSHSHGRALTSRPLQLLTQHCPAWTKDPSTGEQTHHWAVASVKAPSSPPQGAMKCSRQRPGLEDMAEPPLHTEEGMLGDLQSRGSSRGLRRPDKDDRVGGQRWVCPGADIRSRGNSIVTTSQTDKSRALRPHHIQPSPAFAFSALQNLLAWTLQPTGASHPWASARELILKAKLLANEAPCSCLALLPQAKGHQLSSSP